MVFLVLASLGSCATGQAPLSEHAWQAREIARGGTLTVFSLLPHRATIIPKRFVDTSRWQINRQIVNWVDQDLRPDKKVTVILHPPAWVHAYEDAPRGNSGFGLSEHARKTEPYWIEPLLTKMGSRLVLVVVPRDFTNHSILEEVLLGFGLVGASTWELIPHQGFTGKGLGYGVVQGKILDARYAQSDVALRLWLYSGISGSLIASTTCEKQATRLDDADRTEPEVKKLWIHRHGPIAQNNWNYTKSQILRLAKEAVASCLHHLKL